MAKLLQSNYSFNTTIYREVTVFVIFSDNLSSKIIHASTFYLLTSIHNPQLYTLHCPHHYRLFVTNMSWLIIPQARYYREQIIRYFVWGVSSDTRFNWAHSKLNVPIWNLTRPHFDSFHKRIGGSQTSRIHVSDRRFCSFFQFPGTTYISQNQRKHRVFFFRGVISILLGCGPFNLIPNVGAQKIIINFFSQRQMSGSNHKAKVLRSYKIVFMYLGVVAECLGIVGKIVRIMIQSTSVTD